MQRHGKIALKRLIYCGYVQLKLSGTCSECIDRCVFTLYFDQSDRQLFSLLSSHREKQWCVLYDVFACALFAATKPQECYPLLGIFYREQRGDFLFLVSFDCNPLCAQCACVRVCPCCHITCIAPRVVTCCILSSVFTLLLFCFPGKKYQLLVWSNNISFILCLN